MITLLVAVCVTGVAGVSEAKPKKKKQPCVATETECLQKPAGCGGDPDLNLLKNRTSASTDPEDWTVHDVICGFRTIVNTWIGSS